MVLMLSSMVLIEQRGQGAAQPSCFVGLAAGDVQGVDFGASCAFLSIMPASTGGSNRWLPPQPPVPVGAEPAGGDNSARHLPLGRPRRPANAVGKREPSDAERLERRIRRPPLPHR